MSQKKKIVISLIIFIILAGITGYLARYHFLPVDYLTKKAEDACIVMNDNNADKAKECICTLRSVLVIIPEKEVRPLIVKTINKDKVGVKRILASNITFMSAMVAATDEEECNSRRMRFHNGLVKTYHPNGNVMQEQVWENDRLVHITTYYENGNIESDINVLDSDDNGNVIKDGMSKFYYKSGKLAKEYYYKKDVFEGIQTDYNEDGYLELKTTYKNGQLDGLMKSYYENGNIKQEINMQNGKPNGIAKTYQEDGKLLREVNYENGVLIGLMKLYYENGNIKRELNIQNGEPNGITKDYRDDGTLKAESSYRNGKLDGLNKRFYGDGTFCERMWKNDKRQSQICYDKNKNEINLNGLIKFYHKNGQLETEINYINGKAEGTYKIYYTDGSLEEEGTYKNDQLDGEIRQFDNSGKIVSIVNYKNGELIK